MAPRYQHTNALGGQRDQELKLGDLIGFAARYLLSDNGLFFPFRRLLIPSASRQRLVNGSPVENLPDSKSHAQIFVTVICFFGIPSLTRRVMAIRTAASRSSLT